MANAEYVTVGYLGWSNIRSGLEFYVANQGNARWLPRLRPGIVNDPAERGALLQDELETAGCYEGTSVVVIALPGRLPEKLANQVAARVTTSLEDFLAA